MLCPTQSMSFDTKTSLTSFMDDLSVLSDYTHTDLPKSSVIFCPECWEIPQLSINTSNNKIISNCKENNHHKEYNINELCKKCSYHSLSNISCSICQTIHPTDKTTSSDKSNVNSTSVNPSSIIQFLYCQQCKDFFCIKCQKKHLKQNKNHLLILTSKIGVFCLLHNLSYISYCISCNKNLCLKCVNKHISHKIVSFTKIKPFPQEINQKKMEINRERTELKKVEMVFKDAINQIYIKFNKLMEYKLEELNFKESIIMTYEMRNNNYNSIYNFKDLNVKFSKFTFNLFSPNGINDEDILDDSIGIDKIKNIYEYLQNKQNFIFNNSQNKNDLNNESVINNSFLEEEYIYPKKPKKEIKNYTFINNDEEESDEENKRYYELARSLDVRDKKVKKEKKKIIFHQKNKENKINHYKINKEDGPVKKFKLIKTRPINIKMNKNVEDDTGSQTNTHKSDRIINNFPISKSWVKPNSSQINDQNTTTKEEKNKLGKKYLINIFQKQEKFHTQNDIDEENKNENNYSNHCMANESDENNEINYIMKSQEYNNKEIKNSLENNGCYSKKINNIPKFKFNAIAEKKDTNKIITHKPEKIKTIYDNKKEIMNLIILHDGNFCTSSWDSSIKIFNSENYELLLKINEPKNNDVCYVTQLNDDSLILCSNRIFKYKLSEDDKDFVLETVLSGYNDYIIKVIELNDSSLVTCDWEYKIKVWKRLKNTDDNIQYELVNSNINEGEHLSSLYKLNNNEFVSSSNAHLEKGNDALRFYDNNYNNYKTIFNISCSELVDTLCQIDEKYLCVALQKWSSNQVKGIAIINLIKKQIVNTIQGDSMTCVALINSSDKIIITGGRDKTNKKSIIREWKLKNNGELCQIYEVCTEQNDAITSIAQLNDGRILASNYDSTIVVLK